jgi:recombination protein RecA
MPVKPNEIDKIIQAIEKEYGAKKIHSGADNEQVPRIPFPSIQMNIATGGGTPIGKISRWWGNFSSGKSLTSMNLIAAAQRLNLIAEQMLDSPHDEVKKRGDRLLQLFPDGLEVAYYNVEGVYDKAFAQAKGVDTDRLLIVQEKKIEAVGSIVETALGGIHLHIIDSASAAASVDEIGADISDWHRGIKARAWGKVLDHWEEHLDLTENAIVLIDQAKTNQTTGGDMAPQIKSIEHASDLTINFKRGKWLFKRDGVFKDTMPQTGDAIHGKAEADGYEVQAHVNKSRVGRPFRTARLQLDFENIQFNKLHELQMAAKWLGIVQTNGTWYELPEGISWTNADGKEKTNVQGEKQLSGAIEQNPGLEKAINDAVDLYVVNNP